MLYLQQLHSPLQPQAITWSPTPFSSECCERNHSSTGAVGSDKLLLSNDQDIETFVGAFLCVYVCACVGAGVCASTLL